jgi:hypothetical protein
MIRSSIAVVVLALVGGCGSSGGTGQLKASMTDAPTDLTNVKSVLVTINSVRVHDDASTTSGDAGDTTDGGSSVADGGTVTDDGTSGSGWLELCTNTAGETFDLMTLTNGNSTALCGGALLTLPAGRISQARLGVASAKLVFTDGTSQMLTIPSGSETGLKLNIDEDVPAGGTLEIKFDFVASDSIVATGNGKYILKPVLRLAK